MFADMLEDIKSAKEFIFLEFFIMKQGKMFDTIVDALAERAQAGVNVRLIYDDMGCIDEFPRFFYKDLQAKGIHIACFNPFRPFLSVIMNNRDHRKIMVIDGHTAYTGGVNLADEYINMLDRFGHWKDTAMKFTGDAALNFTEMFLEMWNSFRETDKDFIPFLGKAWKGEEEFLEENREASAAVGYVQPFGDTPLDDDPTSENLYIDILSQAVDYVYIYTPYLIIGDTMRHALCMAAARGVDVKIITPGIPDKKLVFEMTQCYYERLMKAGVKIYEYTPGFIHAKSMVCDDESAVVGTINLDYRSLYLHFENAVYFADCEAVAALKRDCEETFAVSKLRTVGDTKRGLFGRIIDSVLRVFETLL
jgi:cardiolipin synthase